ncbi:MAG: ferritin family protein [Thermodesulfobacteriota bacterium]
MDIIHFSGKEILDMALRIERNGEAFYREAARQAKDDSLQTLFKFLEEEEKEHVEDFRELSVLAKEEKITELYDLDYAEEASLYLNALADSEVFTDPNAGAEIVKGIKDDSEAIKIAIGLEKDSILFYYEMLRVVRKEDKRLVESLISQEKDHVKRLAAWRSA